MKKEGEKTMNTQEIIKSHIENYNKRQQLLHQQEKTTKPNITIKFKIQGEIEIEKNQNS